MPAERPVVLAPRGLQLAAVCPAPVAVATVDAAPVPGEPPAGLRVDVLAVAKVEQLMLERTLGLSVRPPTPAVSL